MAEHDLVKIVRESIEAFNSGDPKRIGATLSDNTVLDELATQRKVQGKDAAVTVAMDWRKAFPDAKGTIQKIFAVGDTVAAEILWEGTQKGALTGPAGTVPASGKRVKLRATQIITVENGKITQTNHYFDIMSLMQQIGAVPKARAA